jgi:hypothetical protein
MRAFPIALLMVVTSCHAGVPSGTAPRRHTGEYAFRVGISTLDPVDGYFIVSRDTVTVETAGQACRREPGVAGPPFLHPFSCFPPGGIDRFGMTIDSDRPEQSSWYAFQSVPKSRERCIRYETTARGTQVCAQTRSETYFETVRHSGRLRIIAIDTTKRT